MKTITIQQYQTSDGEIFNDAAEAAGHEAVLGAAAAIDNYIASAELPDRTAKTVRNHITAFLRTTATVDVDAEAA